MAALAAVTDFAAGPRSTASLAPQGPLAGASRNAARPFTTESSRAAGLGAASRAPSTAPGSPRTGLRPRTSQRAAADGGSTAGVSARQLAARNAAAQGAFRFARVQRHSPAHHPAPDPSGPRRCNDEWLAHRPGTSPLPHAPHSHPLREAHSRELGTSRAAWEAGEEDEGASSGEAVEGVAPAQGWARSGASPAAWPTVRPTPSPASPGLPPAGPASVPPRSPARGVTGFRGAATTVVAAHAFVSPCSPYRRTPAPSPAPAPLALATGVLAQLNAALGGEASPGLAAGLPPPPQAPPRDEPSVAEAAGPAGAAALGVARGAAVSRSGARGGPAVRTEVTAAFVRPGRAALQQPGTAAAVPR